MTPNLEYEKSPQSFSSKLRSTENQAANHKGHTLSHFLKIVVHHTQDFVLEETPSSASIPDVQYKIANLKCPICSREKSNNTELLRHYLQHFIKIEEARYMQLGVIHKDNYASLKEAMNVQTRSSYIKKKVENSDFTLNCSFGSPLASFLAIESLKIYMDKPPNSKYQRRYALIELKSVERSFKLFFDFTWIEKNIFRFRENRRRKQNKRNNVVTVKPMLLQKKTVQPNVNRPSISFHQCLAQALIFPTDLTEDILLKETTQTASNEQKTITSQPAASSNVFNRNNSDENLLFELMQDTKTRSAKKRVLEIVNKK
ncbi:Fork-head domain-containing protein [Caenorhabditis elegans]|uniref:Fork-head domain-containing protein n=1 Tax=Caenorhabditis elegans TaxID=6239 RepID=Q21202_CAEEL|nr:Fork-head domain-containing protein [Caenorhabditis elegans]CAA94210.1 Fork-head domain-containing protein [Caenorhabditis elegans]|eukprot:NP_510374.1 Uncharacterized protein CELE_K04C1.3 [Caenorhabditis elegans]